MGTVAREPVTKSVILITYYEIGISNFAGDTTNPLQILIYI